MFLAVAPEAYSMRDTASSLSFSNSAKKVKNDPVQNIKALDTDGTPRGTPTRPKEECCTSEQVLEFRRIFFVIFGEFIKPSKPLVLTPIRNVRILERFTKSGLEEKKALLKVARKADARRKIAEQMKEEKENLTSEEFELGCPR